MPNRKPDPLHKRTPELTQVESEVLALSSTMTHGEIAEHLGIKRSTVRNRLGTAREKVRDLENLKVVGVEYGRWLG
jgi:DNA-directed RNA polymerase specialized sigma24 family protein